MDAAVLGFLQDFETEVQDFFPSVKASLSKFVSPRA
jgi:hypothetical protein